MCKINQLRLKITKLVGYILFISWCTFGCRNNDMNNTVTIFEHNSAGIQMDAQVLARAIKKNTDLTTKIVMSSKTPYQYSDLNIFLECFDAKATAYSKTNWLIVNWELLPSPQQFKKIDKVLCKHKACINTMQKFKDDNNLSYSISYIGFTSSVENNYDFSKKSDNFFFHPAGKSPFKQTNVVLDIWRENQDLPKLIVTCVDSNFEFDCFKHHLVGENAPEKIKAYPNIELHTSYIPKDELREIQEKALFVVAPSEAEGFGHYMSEAKGQGSIVVTTNYPPMNEIIRPEFGFLADSRNRCQIPGLDLWIQTIDQKDLERKIRAALALTKKQQEQMSIEARKSFNEEAHNFEERINELIRKHFGD